MSIEQIRARVMESNQDGSGEEDFDEVDRLRGELDKAQRACQTLGRIVDQQCEAALNATGSHDLLWGDDGDGDWGAIWERVAELGTHKTAVEAVLAEVAEWDKSAEISDNTANDLHRQRNVEAAGLHVYHAELSRNHAARIRTTITKALEGAK